MQVEYLENGDLAVFNGRKYRRDKHTGYYLNSVHRERLHRAVWQYHFGSIPEGYHIHHIDGDKANNEIDNLALIHGSNHCAYHTMKYATANYSKVIENLKKNATPKAAEWHKSEEGRQWHSEHAKAIIANRKPKNFSCLNCGKDFSKKSMRSSKFCSNACKSAYRRKSRVDNETRRCIICGKSFETNRYSKARTCSRACTASLRWSEKREADRMHGCIQHGG